MNFYGEELPVFKANLHTHSDPSYCFTADENIRLYAAKGYDALAFTDHRKSSPVSAYDGRGMTLLSGIELHPAGPRNIEWHLLALGVPEDFPGEYDSAQAAVDAVRNAGGLVFCAHPHWCGITSADILAVKGFSGIEVYNSSTRFIGKEYSEQCWDELIDSGFVRGALAVDDTHRAHHLFHGWTMIAAPDRSPASLLAALEAGRYYATQGPDFTRLELKGRRFEAEFSEAVEVSLIGRRNTGFGVVSPGDPEVGDRRTATEFAVTLPENFHGPLRCRIRDGAGRYAWSVPVMTD